MRRKVRKPSRPVSARARAVAAAMLVRDSVMAVTTFAPVLTASPSLCLVHSAVDLSKRRASLVSGPASKARASLARPVRFSSIT